MSELIARQVLAAELVVQTQTAKWERDGWLPEPVRG